MSENKQPMIGGVKYDQNKNRLELLPLDAIEEVGKVLTYGATKYEERNWEKGMKYSRLFGAALRHLFKFWRGETHDEETNLNALAHAACDILFLLSYELRNMEEFDDRPIELNNKKIEIDNLEKDDTIQSTDNSNHENYISDLEQEKVINRFFEFIKMIKLDGIINFINNCNAFSIDIVENPVVYEAIMKEFIASIICKSERCKNYYFDKLNNPHYIDFILHSKKCCEIFRNRCLHIADISVPLRHIDWSTFGENTEFKYTDGKGFVYGTKKENTTT